MASTACRLCNCIIHRDMELRLQASRVLPIFVPLCVPHAVGTVLVRPYRRGVDHSHICTFMLPGLAWPEMTPGMSSSGNRCVTRRSAAVPIFPSMSSASGML